MRHIIGLPCSFSILFVYMELILLTTLGVQVMLLGHNDDFTADRVMRVTIVFNRFGAGLIERMPR